MIAAAVIVVGGAWYWHYKTNGGKNPSGCLLSSGYRSGSGGGFLSREKLLDRVRLKISKIEFNGEGEKIWRMEAAYSLRF